MLVLLPPSEGKTPPACGAPVDLAGLSHPALTGHRHAVLDAVAALAARPDAAQVLGTGPRLADDVARNARLRTEPAGAAASVYTGVLFAAAALDRLPGAARTRAQRSVRVVSALWGLVAPQDAIPAYRLAMGVDLPGVGPLARTWRPLLARELRAVASERLVVDCRSAPYAAAWRAPAGSVTVRAVRVVAGRRTVVSHQAKHARGVLTRHLLTSGAEPATPDELLEVTRPLVGGPFDDVELSPAPARPGPRVLTLTVA